MENADLRETKQIIYHSEGIDESYPKMYFLLNLSHYVKRYGHLCQFLAFLRLFNLHIPESMQNRHNSIYGTWSELGINKM